MVAAMNEADRAFEKAAAVNTPPKPGSKEPTVHPVVARHTHPSRIKRDPRMHR
jgi:hypothetical protein